MLTNSVRTAGLPGVSRRSILENAHRETVGINGARALCNGKLVHPGPLVASPGGRNDLAADCTAKRKLSGKLLWFEDGAASVFPPLQTPPAAAASSPSSVVQGTLSEQTKCFCVDRFLLNHLTSCNAHRQAAQAIPVTEASSVLGDAIGTGQIRREHKVMNISDVGPPIPRAPILSTAVYKPTAAMLHRIPLALPPVPYTLNRLARTGSL
jgi:hypothetical protein